MPGQPAGTGIVARPVRAVVPSYTRPAGISSTSILPIGVHGTTPRYLPRVRFDASLPNSRHDLPRRHPQCPKRRSKHRAKRSSARPDRNPPGRNDRDWRVAAGTAARGADPAPARGASQFAAASRNLRRRLAYRDGYRWHGPRSQARPLFTGAAPVHRRGPCSQARPLFTSRRFV